MTNPEAQARGLLAEMATGGPNEWGYRDLTNGTFIADDWPFRAVEALRGLVAALPQHEPAREHGDGREKPGWDVDGICNDHDVYLCKRCAITTHPSDAPKAGGDAVLRVYLAARFSRRHECNALGHILKAHGCEITSRWTKPDCDHVVPAGISRQAADHERERFALEDVEDVRAANWTISLMEEPRSNTRGGRHIEFGIALALGHRLTIIGPRETVFHHLPNVEHFETVEAFVASLTPHEPGEGEAR